MENLLYKIQIMSSSFRPWFEKLLFHFVDIVDYKKFMPHSFESLQFLFHLLECVTTLIYKFVLTCSESFLPQWFPCLPLDTRWLIWRRAAKTSLCVFNKENQYKLLMFWYDTPSLLHKPNPTIFTFWNAVGTLLYEVLGLRFTLDPQLFLLNIPEYPVPSNTTKLLIHILMADRCCIAHFWERTLPLSSLDLRSWIMDVRLMEYMTALLHNQMDIFHKVWSNLYAAEHIT